MNTLAAWAKSKGINRKTAYRWYKKKTLPPGVTVRVVPGPSGNRCLYLVDEVSPPPPVTQSKALKNIETKLDEMFFRIQTQLAALDDKLERILTIRK